MNPAFADRNLHYGDPDPCKHRGPALEQTPRRPRSPAWRCARSWEASSAAARGSDGDYFARDPDFCGSAQRREARARAGRSVDRGRARALCLDERGERR
jgi:hypothetical protein